MKTIFEANPSSPRPHHILRRLLRLARNRPRRDAKLIRDVVAIQANLELLGSLKSDPRVQRRKPAQMAEIGGVDIFKRRELARVRVGACL